MIVILYVILWHRDLDNDNVQSKVLVVVENGMFINTPWKYMFHCLKQLLSLHTQSVCPINTKTNLKQLENTLPVEEVISYELLYILSHSAKTVDATHSYLNTIKNQLLASITK